MMKKRGFIVVLVFLILLTSVYAYEYSISGSRYEYPNQVSPYLRFDNLNSN